MKLNWNEWLSSFVNKQIGDLTASDVVADHVDNIVARATNSLPVYGDLSGYLCVAADGSILFHDSETGLTRQEIDTRWRIIATVSASRKFPELSGMLPVRPPSAKPCCECDGTGNFLSSNAFCGSWCGLGWVESPGMGYDDKLL